MPPCLRRLRPLLFVLPLALSLGCGSDDENIDAKPPAAIDDLVGLRPTAEVASLAWTAPGDDGHDGRCADYSIRFHTAPITAANWDDIIVRGDYPTRPEPSGNPQAVAVINLPAAVTYWAGIKAVDDAGNWSGLSNIVELAIGSGGDTTPPEQIDDLSWVFASHSTVTFSWTAPGDDGALGTASSYDLRYVANASLNWDTALRAVGEPPPKSGGTRQSFTVSGLDEDTLYQFAMVATDEANNASPVSNGATPSTTDAPIQVTDEFRSDYDPSVSAFGDRVVFASSRQDDDWEIYVKPVSGGAVTRLTNSPGLDSNPTWFVAGTLIAFDSRRYDSGGRDILTVLPDGSDMQDLVRSAAFDGYPRWSPDGSRLAFASDRNGNMDIWTLTLSGPEAGTYTQITDDGGVDIYPRWSPDGSQITFTRDVGGNNDIYVVTVAGGVHTRLTTHTANDQCSAFSPGGSWIAFGSKRTGDWEIYVLPAQGGEEARLTYDARLDSKPDWSWAPGLVSQIVFCSTRFDGDDDSRDLWLLNVDMN